MANPIPMREIHANLVTQFEEAWIDGRRPVISETISEYIEDRTSLLADLVDLDMEFCWKTDQPFQAEGYFESYPELKDDKEIALRLIRKELELRRRTNKPPTFTEYQERFPEWGDELAATHLPTMESNFGRSSTLSIAATRQIYADVAEQVRRTSEAVKQRYPPGADVEKSQWLTNAVRELFDPQVTDEKKQALFMSDNRALANELFARWSARREKSSDPSAFFLRLAESVRSFLAQRATNAVDETEPEKATADIEETTLASVLADPKRACERDARWEQLRKKSGQAHVYQVNILQNFAGRTPDEISSILDISKDEVAHAIREVRELLQSDNS